MPAAAITEADRRSGAEWIETAHAQLAGTWGRTTDWRRGSLAALSGVELYRSQLLEPSAGDRVRWTRNDPFPGLASCRPARVEAVGDGHVLFCLADADSGSATSKASAPSRPAHPIPARHDTSSPRSQYPLQGKRRTRTGQVPLLFCVTSKNTLSYSRPQIDAKILFHAF